MCLFGKRVVKIKLNKSKLQKTDPVGYEEGSDSADSYVNQNTFDILTESDMTSSSTADLWLDKRKKISCAALTMAAALK